MNAITRNAPPCYRCKKSDLKAGNIPDPNTRYYWAQLWTCQNQSCGVATLYCIECAKFLKHTKTVLPDHNRVHTRKRKMELADPSTAEGGGLQRNSGSLVQACVPPAPRYVATEKRKAVEDAINSTFVNGVSKEFFIRYFRGENMRNHLVARAVFGFGNGDYTQIDEFEIDMHLSTALLCLQLTRSQRELLAVATRLTITATRNQVNALKHGGVSDVETPPANRLRADPFSSANEYRRSYLEGKNSILSNLPYPEVKVVPDGSGDSYISLREIVADVLAKGVENVATLTKDKWVGVAVTTFAMSACIDEMIMEGKNLYHEEDFHIIWIIDWSDGYKNTHIKTVGSEVWGKTVTLGYCHPGLRRKAFEVTYPVALGSKQRVHDKVEQAFSDDLSRLSSGDNYFYMLGHDSPIRVHVKLVASLQDQPERRSINHLMGGNSNLHARWGYSAHISAFEKRMPACTLCLQDMMLNRRIRLNCVECANWDMDRTNLTSFSPPDDKPYPKVDSGLTESGKLLPLRLSYEIISKACQLAFKKVSDGLWTLVEGEQFLLRHCLVNSLVNDILTPAALLLQAKIAQGKANGDQDSLDRQVLELLEASPKSFEQIKLPPIWRRGIELHQHVDVIMHLLFLGIANSVHAFHSEWMKCVMGCREQYSVVLEQCLNSPGFPKIEWCKVACGAWESSGGWVSENLVALARLSNWIVGRLMVHIFSGGYELARASRSAGDPPPTPMMVDNICQMLSRSDDTAGLLHCIKETLHLSWYALVSDQFTAPSQLKDKWKLNISLHHNFDNLDDDELRTVTEYLVLEDNRYLLRILIAAGSPPRATATKRSLQEWLRSRNVTYTNVLFDDSFILPQCTREICLMNLGKDNPVTTSVSNGSKGFLHTLVSAFYTDTNRHKIPMVSSVYRPETSSYRDFQLLVRSMIAMIAMVMAPQHSLEEIDDMDRKIRIFLTRFSTVDGTLRSVSGTKAKPKWIAAYNFVCLLNLPHAARYYGPLRNIWEGGMRGEKFIQEVKPELAQGKRGQWQVYALTNLLQERSLKYVIGLPVHVAPPSVTPVENGNCLLDEKFVTVYDDAAIVQKLLEMGVTPVSALEIVPSNTGSLSMPHGVFRECIAILKNGLSVVLGCDKENYKSIGGTTYFKWVVAYQSLRPYRFEEYKKNGLIRAILLLPIRFTPLDDAMHGAIDSDWHELAVNITNGNVSWIKPLP